MVATTHTATSSDRMVEMREAGLSYRKIAQAIGCSEGLVYWICLKAGAVSPKRMHFPKRKLEPIRRGNHVIRPYSEADDARLVELEAAGLNYSAIGREIGRSRNSVHGRLMTLARRQEVLGEEGSA